MTSKDMEIAIRLIYPNLSDEDMGSVSGMMVECGIYHAVSDESMTLFCWLILASAVNSIREVEVEGLTERRREDMGVIIKAAKGKS